MSDPTLHDESASRFRHVAAPTLCVVAISGLIELFPAAGAKESQGPD